MNWKPKTLYNPSDKEVEWRVGGQFYTLGPKEKDIFDGFVANHALKNVNTGLVEYEPGVEVEKSEVGYEKLPWKELIKLASKEGVFKTGMKREEIELALKEKDGHTN